MLNSTGMHSQQVTKGRRAVPTRALLACGVGAALVYIGADVLAGLLSPGYSFRDQTISELSAVGVATRPLFLLLGFVYAGLLLAFAAGVWTSARRRNLRAAAALLAAQGILGLVAWPLAPMHQRAVLAAGGSTASDTRHLALAAVTSVLILATMALTASALGSRFRLYTLVTVAVLIAFGAWTSLDAQRVAADLSTPWLGIKERVNVYGSMLWLAVLAATLLRRGLHLAPTRMRPSWRGEPA